VRRGRDASSLSRSRAGKRTNANTTPPATKNSASDAIATRWLPVVALTTPKNSGPSAEEARATKAWKPKYSDSRPGGTIAAKRLRNNAWVDTSTKPSATAIDALVSKVTKFGDQLVSLGAGVRYWADGPDNGPNGVGFPLCRDLPVPEVEYRPEIEG